MEPLHKFTNVAKAKLLHQLFPQEIPDLLDFISGMCLTIQEDEDRSRKAFGDGLFSFDFWLYLLRQVEQIINQKKALLQKSDKVFSEQLFEGYLACYTNHCIIVYISTRQHPDEKFTQAVELLFK
jgi:hypothetical protein